MNSPLLQVHRLSKTYSYRTGLFQIQHFDAVKSVSFHLNKKETLAIIGENGSGRSTLAKMIVGMIEPSAGEIFIENNPLIFGDHLYRSQRIRMIFHNASSSLNPRLRIGQTLDFALRLQTSLETRERENHICRLLCQVGLLPDHASYYPHMLAPGQKHRVALARALLLQPDVIVADDPFASLDLSTRAQLINVMLTLQEKHALSYIYVTQDLGIVKHISDKVLVMQGGKVVESGVTQQVLTSPEHNLTKRLIKSYFEQPYSGLNHLKS